MKAGILRTECLMLWNFTVPVFSLIFSDVPGGSLIFLSTRRLHHMFCYVPDISMIFSDVPGASIIFLGTSRLHHFLYQVSPFLVKIRKNLTKFLIFIPIPGEITVELKSLSETPKGSISTPTNLSQFRNLSQRHSLHTAL